MSSSILPAGLALELKRFGIELTEPSDLYAYSEPDDSDLDHVPHRVMFHVVGAVLSGPPIWFEDPILGRCRNYERLRELPELTLSIARQHDVGREADWQYDFDDLVQIDLRLGVPWVLNEERPSVYM